MAMNTIYDWDFSSPTSISREEYSTVGASAFFLGDVQRAFKGSTDFEIWTASSGGTQLTEGTDYTLSSIDSEYSSKAGFNVYYNLTIINATYQTGSIFITYKILGSYVTAELLNDLVSSSILVGEIKSFGGSSTPSGFLACDGSAVSRTTESTLFSAIGTTWGVGDGSTTFNVPDLRGSFLRGAGANGSETMADGNPFDGGSVGDSENDSFQRWQLGVSEDLTGARDYWGVARERDWASSASSLAGATYSRFTTTGQGDSKMVKAMDDGTYGTPRTGDETRPFNNSVLYIIKT